MNARERLLNLFNEWRLYDYIPYHTEIEMLIDFLLANGVIVPPCKKGDTIFVIPSKANYELNILHNMHHNNRIYEQVVDHITIWESDYMLYTCDGLSAVRSKAYQETWFTIREEAEKALAKMKGGAE